MREICTHEQEAETVCPYKYLGTATDQKLAFNENTECVVAFFPSVLSVFVLYGTTWNEQALHLQDPLFSVAAWLKQHLTRW